MITKQRYIGLRPFVNALMGMEFRQNNRPRLTEQLMYGYNPVTLTSERMDWESLATTGWTSAVTDRNTTLSGLATKQSIVRHRYASFYANAGYTYKYRYNITGSIRWDEADLFGLDTNDQHHPLWSVGAGWTLSSEKFMRRVAWVDFLKLRATYGINGNVDQTSTTYFVATYKTLSNPIRTTYLSYNDDDLPNPKLRWEKTATTNIGLDFRILNSRLSGNIEYYNRHASDLLVRRYMDATLGLTSRVVNNGEMRNRGVEVNLTGILFRNKDWDITASLTYAHNSNKMLKVDHSAADVATSFITSPTNYFMEGTSYNTLWAYRLSRVVNGYPVIMDAKGNELATFNSDGTLKDITTTLYGTDDLVNMGCRDQRHPQPLVGEQRRCPSPLCRHGQQPALLCQHLQRLVALQRRSGAVSGLCEAALHLRGLHPARLLDTAAAPRGHKALLPGQQPADMSQGRTSYRP